MLPREKSKIKVEVNADKVGKVKEEAVRLREGRERGSRFEVTCSVIFIGFRRW